MQPSPTPGVAPLPGPQERLQPPPSGDGTTGAGGDPLRESVRGLIDPLSAVVGFASLMLEAHVDDDERRRYAHTVYEAARELERRVRHLESITRDDGEQAEQLALF